MLRAITLSHGPNATLSTELRNQVIREFRPYATPRVSGYPAGRCQREFGLTWTLDSRILQPSGVIGGSIPGGLPTQSRPGLLVLIGLLRPSLQLAELLA